MTLLPLLPPYDALDARCIRVRPTETQILADVLQTIRIGREVNVCINDREDVDQTRQDLISKLVSARLLNHPPQKSRLIAAIGVEVGVRVEVEDLEKLL